MTDGPGGKLFPMEVDGWAEVVGYYADGCIKVDVYEIDGRVGRGYYKILYYTDRWAEGVVWDVVLDGWAEGGIQYRWVVLQNVESGVRSLCCPTRSQVPTTRIGVNCTEFRVPSSGTWNSTHNLVNTFRVKWPTKGCLAECGIRGAKLVLPYEKPSSDHQNVSQPYSEEVINQSYRAPGAAGDLLTWLCEACVALRDAKFRPPKYGSTVPTSEFQDPGVDK
ncbi:hypothetical protein C8R48DRAFT_674803 [Suillus tomentosus]|nr:hypothetical protein C8R48DRAFT_674803 [Suillus tomentosus]